MTTYFVAYCPKTFVRIDSCKQHGNSYAAMHKRLMKKNREFVVCTEEQFAKLTVPTKIVKNLMTGLDVEIPVNTPRCCDPSTELYWSM